MNEKKVLTFSINDKKYTVSTNESEEQLVEAAKIVDDLFCSIASKAQLKNDSKVAIMVALQIAFDLVKQRSSEKEMVTKLENVVSMLDRELSIN